MYRQRFIAISHLAKAPTGYGAVLAPRWGRTAPNLCRLPDVLLLRQHHPGALAVLAFLDVDNPSILFESLFLRLANVCNFFCQGAGLIALCRAYSVLPRSSVPMRSVSIGVEHALGVAV